MIDDKDWVCLGKKVIVYRLITQNQSFYVSKAQAEKIIEILADESENNTVLVFGDEATRAYMIQTIVKEEKRFMELPDYTKRKLLEEGIFTQDQLDGFTDNLKKLLPLDGIKQLNG